MNCKICSTPTTGSIGRAGYRWPNLCQKCKDEQDDALDKSIKLLDAAMKLIEPHLSVTPEKPTTYPIFLTKEERGLYAQD